jgi:hypothetical protein
MPASSHFQYLFALEISAIRDDGELFNAHGITSLFSYAGQLVSIDSLGDNLVCND